jgi:hypothetical protein
VRCADTGAVRRYATGTGLSDWHRDAVASISYGRVARGNRTPGLSQMRAVAVGTALAGGPPHGSQRALLTHWGSCLGCGRRTACSAIDA